MHSRLIVLLVLAASLHSPFVRCCRAGNGDELVNVGRHHCPCKYGDPRRCHCREPHHPCRDCQMSWQPIRSQMHPNLMPAGMLRPWPPLNRKIMNLIPKTPARWLRPGYPWSGCKDGHCYHAP